jgi:cell division topological specificity factor MinE
MFKFFKRNNSKKTAKERLKSVLSRDRANVTSEFLLKMTADIISAAVKYIEPDYESISVSIERNGNGACLMAKMPVNFFKALS